MEWRNIADELPGNFDRVLISKDDDIVDIAEYVAPEGIGAASGIESAGFYWYINGSYYKVYGVIGWMPLPKAM